MPLVRLSEGRQMRMLGKVHRRDHRIEASICQCIVRRQTPSVRVYRSPTNLEQLALLFYGGVGCGARCAASSLLFIKAGRGRGARRVPPMHPCESGLRCPGPSSG